MKISTMKISNRAMSDFDFSGVHGSAYSQDKFNR